MTDVQLFAIGGSAGSLEVLIEALPRLDMNPSYAIVIVLHRKNSADSKLTDLLASRTKVSVKEIEEKEAILPGMIYVAPADYHVLVEADKTFSLDYSEKINFSRPAIDVTFQTAAEVYEDQLICLLLSGSSADGVEGMQVARGTGGQVWIQDPTTAAFSFMPASAAKKFKPDAVIKPGELHIFMNRLNVDNGK